ncbi:MAG: hypothetical protein ACJ72D_05355 [Marmoricola sp.]
MNVEQTITDELRAVAGALRPPPAPDASLLTRKAEQARVRVLVRSGVGAVLTAAVVLGIILLGTHLGNPKAEPVPTPPAHSFPTGAPLTTYVDETGQLHVDGVVQAGSDWADNPLHIGDVTLAYAGSTGKERVVVFVGSTRVATLPRLAANNEPQISPDHSTIAWAEPDGGKGAIVVARLGAQGLTELGRLARRAVTLDPDNEGHESVLSVANDGTVTFGGILGGHTWTPGGTPRDVDLSELSNDLPGFPTNGEDIVRSPAGTWGAWLTDEVDPGNGGGVVEFGAVAFQQVSHPDTRVRIPMPVDEAHLQTLSWQDDTHLLLVVGEGESAYHVVRCDIESHKCERAPMVPAQ